MCDFVRGASELATVLYNGREWADRREHLVKAQECVKWIPGLINNVSRSGIPLFQILAMFEQTAWSPMVGETHERLQSIVVSVMPKEDFGSSYMRGYNRFHCDKAYKFFAHSIFGGRQNGTSMLEIGTYMGDCALWTAGLFPKVSVVGVDVYAPAVEAMNLTGQANEALRGRVRAIHTCIGESDAQFSPRHRKEGRHPPQPTEDRNKTNVGLEPECNTIPCISLNDFNAQYGKFDLIRIHVNGNEGVVLRTGKDLWKRGQKHRPGFAITIVGSRELYVQKAAVLHATLVDMEDNGYVFRFRGIDHDVVRMRDDFLINVHNHIEEAFATSTMIAMPS